MSRSGDEGTLDQDGLRRICGRLLQLQDEERRQVARALHENAAQTIAALSMTLQRMERMELSQAASEALADALQLTGQCLGELRALSHELHPPLLDEAGLASTLRWFVAAFSSRTAIDVELSVAEDFGRLARNAETALFRVAQESLVNVQRHAGSDWARVALTRRDGAVELVVEDRGVGVRDGAPERRGVGIAVMRERLSLLGGSLEISSEPGATRVRAVIRSAS